MAYHKVRENLAISIAPHYTSERAWAVGEYCTKYGLRFRALVAIPKGSEKDFVREHWEFDDIGAGGGGIEPIHTSELPVEYTSDEIREKVNTLINWARGGSSTTLSAAAPAPIVAAAPAPEAPVCEAVVEAPAPVPEEVVEKEQPVRDFPDDDVNVTTSMTALFLRRKEREANAANGNA